MQTPKPRSGPLGFLALVLALGLTAPGAGAANPETAPTEYRAEADAGQKRPVRTAWTPIRRLAERLDLHWLNTALERPGFGQLLRHNRVALGRPFGEHGPELQLSWQPGSFTSLNAEGKSGLGELSPSQPELHLGLRRSW